MGDCKKHLKSVGTYTNMSELAEDIGNLHYETLSELLSYLSDKLDKDSIKDMESDRNKLAISLSDASIKIYDAKLCIDKSWEISKPYMKNK